MSAPRQIPPRPQNQGVPSVFVVAVIAFVVLCFATLRGDWSGLFSFEAVKSMASLFAGFVPPATDANFMRQVFLGFFETLAISALGTLLAVALGLALAMPASRTGVTRGVARITLNALRAVPELVWAALLVIAAGLGPFPGTLALALHTSGVLGRLFADAFENAPREPALALSRNGARRSAAFWYGTIPSVLPQLASYTLYRWENNIRAAAVLGVVGGGGLGQLLYYHLALFHFNEAGTVLAAMLLIVGLVDVLSDQLRRSMSS